jgi:hypothetical protein
MDFLCSKHKLKDGSVKEPDFYSGVDILKWKIDSCDDPTKLRWAMSSDTYVKRAVAEVESITSAVDDRLSTKVSTSIALRYRPKLDVTDELDPKKANYYQGLIGIL